MNLISSLSILGFASEHVSVIRIYQDSKVKEPMEITGEQKHPSKKYLKRCTKEERKQCIDFTWFHNLFAFLSSSPCTHNKNTSSMML